MALRKRKSQGKTWVYKVEVKGLTRYVGITCDLTRRQSQHNSGLKKGEDKELYNFLREEGIDQIELIPIEQFPTRVTAKRYECLLILQDLFGERILKQKCPSISDR
jgi:predicted GIY-YIG superfamily endonuclease